MPVFDMGTVFNRFFNLLGENFAVFALLGLVGVILPTLGVTYGMVTLMSSLFSAADPEAMSLQMFTAPNLIMSFGGGLVMLVFQLVVLSMITEVAILRAIGKPADIGGIFGHALRNILPLLAISILTGLMIMLGFLFLIIPGIFLALATCVAVPSYVGEPGRGIFGSISRSFELTKGRRWWLLLIFIILFVAAMMISGTLSSLAMPSMMMNGATTPDLANFSAMMMPYQLLNAVVSGALSVVGMVFMAAVYVCLRETREPLTPENTANVF